MCFLKHSFYCHEITNKEHTLLPTGEIKQVQNVKTYSITVFRKKLQSFCFCWKYYLSIFVD